jgi:CBS-domain-containing membrane protein
MFSLYGVNGRVFRGSLEQLRQISPVSRVSRTQGIEPIGTDGIDSFDESMRHASAGLAHPPVDLAHRVALESYAQTLKPETQQRHPLTRVESLMATQVITLPSSATVQQAWQLLAQQGVGQAPVVNLNGTLVGLVSRADLMKADALPLPNQNLDVWRTLMSQSVATVMWSPVPSVSPQTDIRRVANVLLDTGLPGLPVVDDEGVMVGFVSRSDILRAVTNDPPLDLWG